MSPSMHQLERWQTGTSASHIEKMLLDNSRDSLGQGIALSQFVMTKLIFETDDLLIRKADLGGSDVDMFYELWNSPVVMKYVGFPEGLQITKEAIRIQIMDETDSEFDCKLVVCLKSEGTPIGECKLGLPNDVGISDTDVKILPEFWGNGFGVQIKRGLIDYLFTYTDCQIVRATPNKLNTASIKMQEAVGGIRVGEDIYKFPVTMKLPTCDVPHYIYHVRREGWEKGDLHSRFNASG